MKAISQVLNQGNRAAKVYPTLLGKFSTYSEKFLNVNEILVKKVIIN